MKLIRSICEFIARKVHKKNIQRDGDYLERYYLSGWSPFGLDPERHRWFKWMPGIYLHHFLNSDPDNELHNHPFDVSYSLILTGGYIEHRRHEGSDIVSRILTPGCTNTIRHDHFHRVELIEKDAWTLFIAGKRIQDWGFWDPDTDTYTPWKEYLKPKDNTP